VGKSQKPCNHKAFGDISAWSGVCRLFPYPGFLFHCYSHPDNNTEGPRRPKRWLNIWLSAKVTIKPTAKIQEKLEAINAQKLPVSKPKPHSEPNLKAVLTESEEEHTDFQQNISVENNQKLIPGWALSEALKLRGWTKSHLAERLGLQKSLPGKWINGTRKIQPQNLQMLWDWLAPELNQVLSN
jgi:hypothetical protein